MRLTLTIPLPFPPEALILTSPSPGMMSVIKGEFGDPKKLEEECARYLLFSAKKKVTS